MGEIRTGGKRDLTISGNKDFRGKWKINSKSQNFPALCAGRAYNNYFLLGASARESSRHQEEPTTFCSSNLGECGVEDEEEPYEDQAMFDPHLEYGRSRSDLDLVGF
uniref:Uncharacterized protein n=1 Tax=Romanomermis culicivorax TaxID=13658 RepID=A0A915KLM9_ROMCU